MTRNNHKGFVLATSLLFSSILLIIIIAYSSRVATEYKLMKKIYNSNAALNLAEAGIERGLWEMGYNSGAFTGWENTVVGGNQIHVISVNSFQSASGENIGDYTVTVVASADGMSATATGTGYVPNSVSPDETRTVKVVYARNNFSKAVLALNGIVMSGQARTDSYDSSLGTYDSQPHTQEGDIATNGSIGLSGQAYVNGDANPGPDYPFEGVPSVSGSYGTLQAPFTVDPIPQSALDDARLDNNNTNIIHEEGHEPLNGYVLSIASDESITLPTGTYYFTSISVTGMATINAAEGVIIYVDGGDVNISGQGIVNSTGQPRDLMIYSTGSNINFSGMAAVAGAIYAPTATVKLTGQEDFYGAVVCGNNMDSGQAAIHYDLDLLGVMPVFAKGRVISWQELV